MDLAIRSRPSTPKPNAFDQEQSLSHGMATEEAELPEKPEVNFDVPSNSPLCTFPQKYLTPALASSYPNGHEPRPPRSLSQQRAFDERKAETMRTMTKEQIEERYMQVAQMANRIAEADRKKNEELDGEIEKLQKQREMERKLFWKMKKAYEEKHGGGSDEPKVKEEGEA